MLSVREVIKTSFFLAVVAALLLLGANGLAAHADDGCSDGDCSSLQCDMAAGSGCASPCVHAMAAMADWPNPADPVHSMPSVENPPHALRLKDRLFRPPILA